jgi:hypothetical protein
MDALLREARRIGPVGNTAANKATAEERVHRYNQQMRGV